MSLIGRPFVRMKSPSRSHMVLSGVSIIETLLTIFLRPSTPAIRREPFMV